MLLIALKMLLGDRTKYATLVLGLAFATLLINQQAAIFMGLLIQSTGALQNVTQPDLWVADPSTQWIGEYRALADKKLDRVRSVAGVAWAEPLYSNVAVIELPNGTFQRAQILGLPRSTLIGRPVEVTSGNLEDLRIPDAVMIEETSLQKLGYPKIGETLKLNDERALVVGYCKAKKGFESNAIIYTTFDNAVRFTPTGRRSISYIVAKVQEGRSVEEVAGRINALGDVIALTPDQFRWRTVRWITFATGIGINFGITIVLGFVVGLALSAAIFYQFTVENIRHFAVLKALGAKPGTLIGMVLLQALSVGVIGYGIGVGAAAMFTLASRTAGSELAVFFPWQLAFGSFLTTLLCIGMGSVLSLKRVLTVAPAMIFGS
jgi:putative ABC transport system permease protein